MAVLICKDRQARQVDSAKSVPLLAAAMTTVMTQEAGTPICGARAFLFRRAPLKFRTAQRAVPTLLIAAISLVSPQPVFAQADPASEPAVLAVAKVLPAVVNINTERIVRRRVRDPFEDFAAQYFGNYRSRPREIRQTLQSLGSGFIVDPAGYIVTNEHVVQRAADLKIEVTMNDGKTYNARYIAGDEKKDLAFIKIEAKADFPFINLDNISPNLLGQTVLVVGNALGYGSSISRGVLSGAKRDITIDEIEYKDLLADRRGDQPGKQRRAARRSFRTAGRSQLRQDGVHAAGRSDAGTGVCHSRRYRPEHRGRV